MIGLRVVCEPVCAPKRRSFRFIFPIRERVVCYDGKAIRGEIEACKRLSEAHAHLSTEDPHMPVKLEVEFELEGRTCTLSWTFVEQ